MGWSTARSVLIDDCSPVAIWAQGSHTVLMAVPLPFGLKTATRAFFDDADAVATQPSVAESGRHLAVVNVVDADASQPSEPDAVRAIVQL